MAEWMDLGWRSTEKDGRGMAAWMGEDKWANVHMGICMEDQLCPFWMQYHIGILPAGSEEPHLLPPGLTVCLKQTLTAQEAQWALI